MIVRKETNVSVLDAAYMRIKNIFANGLPVVLSTSGGKDSLVLCQLVYDLIQRGEIDPKQLTVQFVDEEGMYDDVIEIVKNWRKKFMMAGVKFEWYCLEVKHFNALNQLETKETWVCWDRYEKDKWMRQPPPFAIREHPLLRARKETYQDFLKKINRGKITLVGSRAAESFQRLFFMSKLKQSSMITKDGLAFPIYDWTDDDVWLFIKERKIDFPITYMRLYQCGVPKNRLRISCLFAIDTIGALVKMAEFDPDLMERVQRREPNAYLVSLYWDSEMFRRSSTRRKQSEKGQPKKDYKKLVTDLLSDIPKNFNGEHSQKVARRYKRIVVKASSMMQEKHYKDMYEALLAGDTKLRRYRAIIQKIYGDARKEAVKEVGNRREKQKR